MRRRTSSGSSNTSNPWTLAVPCVAEMKHVRMRIVVRLPGAVRAEEADDFAAVNLEAHLVEGAGAAEPLR